MASFEDVLGSDDKLAKRLASTSWPDSRAKADRLLPLVTAANTDLVRDAVQAARDEEISWRGWHLGNPLANALVMLVYAAGDGDKEAAATLLQVAKRLRDKPVLLEHRSAFWELFGMFRDIPAGDDAFETLDAVYRGLPPTPAAQWAAEIGLAAPTDCRWYLQVVVISREAPTVDVDVRVRWSPDLVSEFHEARMAKEFWSGGDEVRLYGPRVPVAGPLSYQLPLSDEGVNRTLTGAIDPAPADIRDLPRILRTVEEQNGITFDRAKAQVSGAKRPMRPIKPVRAWLRANA